MIARLLREYVLRFPLARGKGFVLRHVTARLPEHAREFETRIGPVTVSARWDEVAGRRILRTGHFESAELEAALAAVAPGDTVIDVGANIGLLTCPLAWAVGSEGTVVAVEPLADNVRRLRANLERNGLENTQVIEAAAAEEDGRRLLRVAGDPAFASLLPIVKHSTVDKVEVPVRSLDSIWSELGQPDVALVKIDVEGAELDVIEGAAQLLEQVHPALIVESDPGDRETRMRRRLDAIGYDEATPHGFAPNNYLYRARGTRT